MGNDTGNLLSDGANTYSYDRLDRVTSITHTTPYGEAASSFNYAYDLLGNRTSVTESVSPPAAYDLIFADGFESGDFVTAGSPWSAGSGW